MAKTLPRKQGKTLLTLFFPLLSLLFSSVCLATDTDDAINLLNKMNNAVQTQNYQINFITQDKNQYVTTFEYSHIGATTPESLIHRNSNVKNNDAAAHLLYLEGPAKEIILHHNITSYFQPDSASFSITSPRIVEAFPDVIYNDFKQLANTYDFILLGKTRTANRSVQLIRIIAKDKDRYNYVVWIDDETYLPLRIDLIDLNNELLQQMKVVEFNQNFDKKKLLNYIDNRTYPILLAIEKKNNNLDEWQLTWLPTGFKEIAAYNISFYNSDIATKLFSDGVFSFTVNISDEQTTPTNQLIQQGGRTIFSTNLNKKNIIIIGNLPLTTIERIAQNITEKSPS
ncbi:MucB/RseB C-terminal domain-containing protein [Orbaceae bacterium ESL0727]|nr:MucB/RseB C-terminal domain-containing protein [Orbaceae bacterium ESL0727]